MKKVNTKTSKKIVAVVIAVAAACSVMGCSVEKNFTKTETHTYTDENGNTVTTTTTNHNGEVTTETTTYTAEEAMAAMGENRDIEEIRDVAAYKDIPVTLTNDMGWDIAKLYVKMSGQDEWSDNFIPEDQCFYDGITANGMIVSYTEEQHFMNIKLVDCAGNEVKFTEIDLPADGAEQIEVVFEYDAENDVFTAYAK